MLEQKKSDAKNDLKYLETWLVSNGWEIQHHLSDMDVTSYAKMSDDNYLAISLHHKGLI